MTTAVREVLESLPGSPAALARLRAQYTQDRQALEAGELARLPAAASPGLEAARDAVGQAWAALPADPQTVDAAQQAIAALLTLQTQVRLYLDAEAQALLSARQRYAAARKEAESQDLARMPGSAPAGLADVYANVLQEWASVPADVEALEVAACNAALAALAGFRALFADFIKQAAMAQNVAEGAAKFGARGTLRNRLAGQETLNATQDAILDEQLRKKLEATDHALTEAELQEAAQQIVDKTRRLAETPVDSGGLAGINAKLAKSPALKDNIVRLQRDGWTLVQNEAGKGSYCDKEAKTIALDPSSSMEVALGNLAHETGHALYTPPAPPTVASLADGLRYVRECTETNFLDEGEAQMVACKATEELTAGGVASQVPADSGVFMAVWQKFKAGQLTEDAARKEMAKQFGNLITSTTHEKYLVYYGKFHLGTWNQAHVHEPAKQLPLTALDTLVLFP